MVISCYTYSFPFKEPFSTSSGSFSMREGIILELIEKDHTALGEAAPLPSFSRESRQDVLNQLKEYGHQIKELFEGEPTLGDLQVFHRKHNIYPSLQFGLDTLATDLLSQREKTSAREFLFNDAPDRLHINGVLPILEIEESIKKAGKLAKNGFQTIKAKIGFDFDTEQAVLKKIRQSFPKLTIRVDANQAWELNEACHYLRQLQPLDIEYCEEPLNKVSPQSLKKIASETGVPIALDESLLQIQNFESILPHCSAIIMKPMVFGGLGKLFATNRLAEHHNNKVIYTTSLESGIGRTMTAILAAGLGDSNSAHGLATGSLLKMDVWHDGTYINNGSFLLPDRVELGKRYNSNHKYLDKVLTLQ